MSNNICKFIKFLTVAIAFLTLSCANKFGSRVSVAEYPFLVHTEKGDSIIWRKNMGPDFDVFYGELKSLKNAGFGFYRGGHPNTSPIEGAAQIQGKLGAFEVVWSQTTDLQPARVYRKAIFDYSTRITKMKNNSREFRYVEKIHVWVYGVEEGQVETLTEYLSRIELFREKPKDIIFESR